VELSSISSIHGQLPVSSRALMYHQSVILARDGVHGVRIDDGVVECGAVVAQRDPPCVCAGGYGIRINSNVDRLGLRVGEEVCDDSLSRDGPTCVTQMSVSTRVIAVYECLLRDTSGQDVSTHLEDFRGDLVPATDLELLD